MFDYCSAASRFSVGRCLRQHTTLLVSFLSYPNKAISSITLDLLVALGFPFITFSVSDKMKIVKTCVSFFFKLLHQYSIACQHESKSHVASVRLILFILDSSISSKLFFLEVQ
jgi:hypothetical protein